jgi:hypothetical protein
MCTTHDGTEHIWSWFRRVSGNAQTPQPSRGHSLSRLQRTNPAVASERQTPRGVARSKSHYQYYHHPMGASYSTRGPGKVESNNIAKGLTVASSLTILISETWMEACNRSSRPEPSRLMSEIARRPLGLQVEACHWCISSSWLAIKEMEKGRFCPFLRCHLLVRCLLPGLLSL